MRKFLFAFIFFIASICLNAQDPQRVLSSIFDEALTDRTAWMHLEYLCKQAKGRLSGSAASYRAIDYTKKALTEAGADTVWLQEVKVPFWERGYEKCFMKSASNGKHELSIAALGLSIGTSKKGITSKVIEIKDPAELKTIDANIVKGKIVFFNKPVDNSLVNTFAGYAGAVGQRSSGASDASKLGAAAVIVRSVTQSLDDFPHTGVTHYAEGVNPIPAVAVSTIDAELLSNWLRKDPKLEISLISTCVIHPDTISYNVIGELRGSLKPEEIITVGGHLDSWDITEGAHDDAGGCVQAIEMIRMYRKLGIKPKRTVRAVMFMNEEMSSTGGRKYAEVAKEKGEIHYAALESDRGVMSPIGFGFDAEGERLQKIQSIAKWFYPYNIRSFDSGGGGSDIAPLKALGAMQIGYIPDSQRYFSYHHSAHDTFEEVNIRELQMGSAAITSLIYLIDLLDL